MIAKEILEKHYKNHEKRIAYPENVYTAMEEYTIMIIQQYTSLEYESAKALVARMDDYLKHPKHKLPGEDPGY